MQNTQWSRLEAMMALLSPAARHGTGGLRHQYLSALKIGQLLNLSGG